MYKVVFTVRDSDSYAYEVERHEFCFVTDRDASNFYDDLETWVAENTKGNSYVDQKFKPEKLPETILYGYDPAIRKLYRVG